MVVTLTDRDQEMLAFERQWWQHAGSKETAIQDLFGLTSTRYHQQLLALIDRPEALAADPVLVNRLRRRVVASAQKRRRLAR